MNYQLIEVLAHLKPEDARRVLKLADDRTVLSADQNFAEWAHPGQLPPEGNWNTWVIKAGRGFGKTRAGAEWVTAAARANGDLRIALVAASIEEARSIMVEGQSGVLAVGRDAVLRFVSTRNTIYFRSGAEATLFSGFAPESLRGPEHHLAWCDELAKWKRAGDSWNMLQLGLRLGDRPRALVTTTPKPGPVLSRIMAADSCVVTGGGTRGNPHLPAAFVDHVEALYAGTRLGRQELDGELLPDVAGALWTVELIERCRIDRPRSPLRKTVIGVDPPSGAGTCGIIACAIDRDGTGYVLADHSVTGRSPEGWARAVANAAEAHGAQMVVVETNQGGAMVDAVLRAADAKLRMKSVTAGLSKTQRAAPVATQFEGGKIKFLGHFPELEAELCGLVSGGDYEGPGRSPDRADACVWALTELIVQKDMPLPAIRQL